MAGLLGCVKIASVSTMGKASAGGSPKHKAGTKDENDARKQEGDVCSVHGKKDGPASPVILMLEPYQDFTEDSEALRIPELFSNLSGSQACLARLYGSQFLTLTDTRTMRTMRTATIRAFSQCCMMKTNACCPAPTVFSCSQPRCAQCPGRWDFADPRD